MNKLLIIKLNLICLVSLLAAMQNCIAAPLKHKEAGLPTFCNSQNIGSNPGCGKTPTAGFDKQGLLWVVYVDGGHIKLVSSIDLATSFSETATITLQPENIYADGENRPKIAFGPNKEIYLSWVQKSKGRYAGNIKFSRSLDRGKTFSTPIIINDDGLLTSHRFETLAVAPDGRIHLVWLDKRDLIAAKNAGKAYTGAALYHAVSIDKGATFSTNRKIADHTCECCRISIEFDQQGNAIALWRHIFDGMIRDHAIVNLDNPNILFNISRVTFDNWQIEACPHHGPDMAVDEENKLHLVWFTGLKDRGGLFYGRFNQITQQLEQQLNIDPSPTSSRPQVLVHEEHILLIWKVFEQDQSKLQLMISNDGGDNWSDTTTLTTTSGNSDYPLLFSHNNKVYTSWWTSVEGFQLIHLSDYIQSKETISLRPFNKDSLAKIETRYKGTEYLFVLWSVDCPPCFKELELLSKLHRQNKLPKLILVSTDKQELISEIELVLEQYGLEHVENWYFNNMPDLLRSKIDQYWFGELPRSYHYTKNGKRSSHSGVLNLTILQNWFNRDI